VLVYEPLTPRYDQLRFADLINIAVWPPILDMMDFLLGELCAARMASSTRMVPCTSELESSDVLINWTRQHTVPNNKQPVHHRFQSFWYGEALSPYELFCLKSFIDHGHAVDLYTYDANLVAPERDRHRHSRMCSGTSFSSKRAVGGLILTSYALLSGSRC
jgi:hypothetical protein